MAYENESCVVRRIRERGEGEQCQLTLSALMYQGLCGAKLLWSMSVLRDYAVATGSVWLRWSGR